MSSLLFHQTCAMDSFKDLKIKSGNAAHVMVIRTFKTEVHKGSRLLFAKIRMFRVPWVMNPPPDSFHSFSWMIFSVFLLPGFIKQLLWVQPLSLISHHSCLDDPSAPSKLAAANSCLKNLNDNNWLFYLLPFFPLPIDIYSICAVWIGRWLPMMWATVHTHFLFD